MINSRIHGIIDYLVVIFLLASPTLFSLAGTTALFTYILAGIHLALTICTNYEYGLVRFIPLKIHGYIELVVSLALVGLAFYLGSLEGNVSRNFYIGFAIAVFVVWILTDYRTKPSGKREIPYIESNTDGDMI
ncbi:hypothetical protein I5M32_03315 [Pedobacter sp. SD-b]|uniref:SPW repeat-containing protein n=1 Tax=Pedobacter segetis TaxID=2793069 RepID=A0ABS1BGJ8_9SPHI|nr:hypothetical protein [Pedobacter segetis]MBK0381978.1 hypothetical protein [Pedobacter segetis]